MDENKTVLTLAYEDGTEMQVIIIDPGEYYQHGQDLEEILFAAKQCSDEEPSGCTWAVRVGGNVMCRTFGWLEENQVRRMFEVMDLAIEPPLQQIAGDGV